MTENKSIMINGINVSGYKHFKNRTCLADYLLTDMDYSEAKCKLCKDCYFKQLARKTQECEILQQSENEAKEILQIIDEAQNDGHNK